MRTLEPTGGANIGFQTALAGARAQVGGSAIYPVGIRLGSTVLAAKDLLTRSVGLLGLPADLCIEQEGGVLVLGSTNFCNTTLWSIDQIVKGKWQKINATTFWKRKFKMHIYHHA